MGNNRNHYLSEEMIDRYCDEYLKESSKSITLKEDDKTNLLQMDELTQEITMVKNIDAKVVLIYEDKLELILNDYCKKVETKGDYITPLSLILSIATTLFTSTFSDKILDARVWEGLFWIALVINIIWFIKSLISFIKIGKQTEVKEVMKEICGGKK